jgi:hypothetical protein
LGKGQVRTYTYNDKGLGLSLIGKTLVAKGNKPVTSLRFKEWGVDKEARDSLLVNSCDSSVKLYRYD